jgi:hypothetical protein
MFDVKAVPFDGGNWFSAATNLAEQATGNVMFAIKPLQTTLLPAVIMA